jgi:hypothetical protein
MSYGTGDEFALLPTLGKIDCSDFEFPAVCSADSGMGAWNMHFLLPTF